MPDSGRRLFVFGLGYSATALVRLLLAEGWSVTGTRRDPDGAAALAALGVHPVIWDGTSESGAVTAALAGATHVLASIPPDDAGDPVVHHFGPYLERLPGLAWMGYLSTVGVYGDTGGQPVDEDTPPNPSGARGRRRVLAESQWLRLGERSNRPVHLFRLPGIYGPGRSALDKARAGRAPLITRPGHRFSRVHVDDIAGVLRASMDRPRPGAIYNVCDREPAEPATVNAFAYSLLGMAPPPPVPFAEAVKSMSPMARSFWRDNRLVIADRIIGELGYHLRYPSYREGLAAVLAAEKG